MHTNQFFILAFAAATTLATALPPDGAPALNSRQTGVTCQTSKDSPSTGDITDVINEMKGWGDDIKCPQTNGKASDCTTLARQGSAAISICGGTDPSGGGHDCKELAQKATQIQTSCLSDGRAGGQYTIDASQRVE
ncbi:MAG: hypothetical protein Q9198_007577, partial [Flavoplaca austrocitrina]